MAFPPSLLIVGRLAALGETQRPGGGDTDHAHPRQHRPDVRHDDRADPGADHHCEQKK